MVIKELTFREKTTNDLKLVKIYQFEEKESPHAIEINTKETERVLNKLQTGGWLIFPEGITNENDWN